MHEAQLKLLLKPVDRIAPLWQDEELNTLLISTFRMVPFFPSSLISAHHPVSSPRPCFVSFTLPSELVFPLRWNSRLGSADSIVQFQLDGEPRLNLIYF